MFRMPETAEMILASFLKKRYHVFKIFKKILL